MTLLGNLLDGVAPETLATWEAAKRRKLFKPGEELFAIGETPRMLYQISSGRAKLWRPSRNGHALTLFYASAGDVPGLVAICRQVPAQVMVTVVAPIEAFAISAGTILTLVQQDSRLAANAFKIAANMVYVLADRLADMSSARIDQKIGRALLRFACEHGDWIDDHKVRIMISRQELADLTSSTHYTVSRMLSEWARRGIVQSGRGFVVIQDEEALAAIAELDGMP